MRMASGYSKRYVDISQVPYGEHGLRRCSCCETLFRELGKIGAVTCSTCIESPSFGKRMRGAARG